MSVQSNSSSVSDQNQTRRITVITTGGTIEKSYDELDGILENRTSIIKSRIISKLRLPFTELNFYPLFAKDSLLMTDEDRQLIFNQVNTLLPLKNPIVVLHGTDTMEISAAYCFERLGELAVPVIFTGAMKPLGFENSDALQNVTEALYSAGTAKPGVYISFHGSLWNVPHVKKNKVRGTFEGVSSIES